MSIFSRDFKLEKQRLSMILFGPPKVGKTRAILDLAKRGDYVALISTDHGTLELYRNPSLYKGHLMAAEVYNLIDMRKALEEGKDTVRGLIKKGIPSSKIWAVIDTITHLQIMLLTEARRISIKHPETQDDTRDEYIRDVTTQTDWGINLGLMSECANMLNSYPCNIVCIALEREDRTTGRPGPSISGQSRDRFVGDADLILRLIYDSTSKKRKFCTSIVDGAGDRSGVLGTMEELDLIAMRDKIFKTIEQPAEAKPEAPKSESKEKPAVQPSETKG